MEISFAIKNIVFWVAPVAYNHRGRQGTKPALQQQSKPLRDCGCLTARTQNVVNFYFNLT